jgi:hypothetical protein
VISDNIPAHPPPIEQRLRMKFSKCALLSVASLTLSLVLTGCAAQSTPRGATTTTAPVSTPATNTAGNLASFCTGYAGFNTAGLSMFLFPSSAAKALNDLKLMSTSAPPQISARMNTLFEGLSPYLTIESATKGTASQQQTDNSLQQQQGVQALGGPNGRAVGRYAAKNCTGTLADPGLTGLRGTATALDKYARHQAELAHATEATISQKSNLSYLATAQYLIGGNTNNLIVSPAKDNTANPPRLYELMNGQNTLCITTSSDNAIAAIFTPGVCP